MREIAGRSHHFDRPAAETLLTTLTTPPVAAPSAPDLWNLVEIDLGLARREFSGNARAWLEEHQPAGYTPARDCPGSERRLRQDEAFLYGASRAGTDRLAREIVSAEYASWHDPVAGVRFGFAAATTVTTAPTPTAPATPGAHFTHDLGHKRYEIANHLGNVLATVSDRRLAVDANSDKDADGYRADIYSLSDYYPFGMEMRRRTASLYVNTTTQQAELLLTETAAAGGTLYVAMDKYRYGFQGLEQDDEWQGDGASYTTEFRQYDPRLGKWLSRDPVFQPYQSPYKAFGDNPVNMIDPNGAKEYDTWDDYKADHPEGPGDGTDGHWTTADRYLENKIWEAANRFNLHIKNENGKHIGMHEYKSIKQRSYFYRWMAKEFHAQGHEVNWVGAATVVAFQMSLTEDYALTLAAGTTGWLAEELAAEGNKKIFNDVFDNLAELDKKGRAGSPLKGKEAADWDRATLRHEQYDVVQPVYEDWAKFSHSWPLSIVFENDIDPRVTYTPLEGLLTDMARQSGIWGLVAPSTALYSEYKYTGGRLIEPGERFKHGMKLAKMYRAYLNGDRTPKNIGIGADTGDRAEIWDYGRGRAKGPGYRLNE